MATAVCDVDEVFGCTDPGACNFDPGATEEDGSCAEIDECGVCGGTGIAPGECDCDGNVLDECAFVAVKELSLARAIATASV